MERRHPFWHYLLVILVTLIRGAISEFVWFLIGLGGFFIFQSRKSPYNIVFGIPLFLIGLGFVVNSLWTELLSVFSPQYNKAVCFICNTVSKSERIDDKGHKISLDGDSEEVKY